jgi:hypothetical protein
MQSLPTDITATAPSSMADRQGATPPAWLHRSKWYLFWSAFGGFRQNWDKFTQLMALIAAYLWPPIVRRRLLRLRDAGHVEQTPTLAQLLVAARDQMLLSAIAETRIFYQAQNIPWRFHNFRRFLSGPATLIDPTGLIAPRDAVIHHVLQTFHRHPLYDLVLLQAHKDGVAEMQRQANQIVAGTHSHQRALETLIEDGSYHARLIHDVSEFAKNPLVPARLIPGDLLPDAHMMLAMDQFKDMRGYTNYAARLKVSAWGAIGAWLAVVFDGSIGKLLKIQLVPKGINIAACDSDLVARYPLV